MAYRFTNTEKWSDAWFSELTPIQKLLFIYICDNCDIAGFIEYTPKIWAVEIGTDLRGLEGALKGLGRGLISAPENSDVFFIRNFLKHQKNLPLNPENKAHSGIIKRFDLYKNKFKFNSINEFLEGASKGLPSPIGIGKGISKGNDKDKIDNKHSLEYKLYGEFQNVKLTDEDYEKAKVRYAEKLPRMIEKLSAFIKTKGDKYKDHYATFSSWVEKAVDEEILKSGGVRNASTIEKPKIHRNI